MSRSCAGRLCLWTVLIACFVLPVVYAQAIVDFRIATPRNFGYTIGDRITHEMHLVLAANHSLDSAALAKTGRINRWLEIAGTNVEIRNRENQVRYHISIDYLIVNAPREPASITIPQHEFTILGDTSSSSVFLPEWTFGMGPIASSGAEDVLILQPDRRPRSIPVIGRQLRLRTLSLILGGLLIYLAYLRWVLPRIRRERFPFSVALRKLRHLQRSECTPATYRRGVQALHAAVNAAAGQVIFSVNLCALFAAHPEFRSLESDLSQFYSRSRDVFFNNAAVAQPESSLQELIDLCSRCRTLERSYA
ncbi:MAG: hypothetical protein OEW68_03940 [Gammaproteobacteria bacterium]|nr:hypothetical protein [Gammaproteobacteria bacterium]MDH4313972.1 hypothetical protein [Gammaproteobacteria bacterium]MDH5212706.1 hypothetical protein [Gammaproteobacteria bacterium]